MSTTPRIAVGVELWSDSARALIRTAAAFAGQFAAPWLAIGDDVAQTLICG